MVFFILLNVVLAAFFVASFAITLVALGGRDPASCACSARCAPRLASYGMSWGGIVDLCRDKTYYQTLFGLAVAFGFLMALLQVLSAVYGTKLVRSAHFKIASPALPLAFAGPQHHGLVGVRKTVYVDGVTYAYANNYPPVVVVSTNDGGPFSPTRPRTTTTTMPSSAHPSSYPPPPAPGTAYIVETDPENPSRVIYRTVPTGPSPHMMMAYGAPAMTTTTMARARSASEPTQPAQGSA
jgi:hypothetical protein